MAKRKAHPKKKRGQGKFDKVMHEWGQGKLRSGSGRKVTDQDQALAIAFSEQRRKKHRRGR